jgi:hypothetical protein
MGLVSLSYVLITGKFNLLTVVPEPDVQRSRYVRFACHSAICFGWEFDERSRSLRDSFSREVGRRTYDRRIGCRKLWNEHGHGWYPGLADAAAIGSVMIPSMVEDGYEVDFSAAICSVGATVGPIIPPSIPFVIYAAMGNVSVAGLFLAGVFPGLLLGLSLMVPSYLYARRKKIAKTGAFSSKSFLRNLVRSIRLAFPVIILGGFWGRVYADRSCGCGCAYAVLLG